MIHRPLLSGGDWGVLYLICDGDKMGSILVMCAGGGGG